MTIKLNNAGTANCAARIKAGDVNMSAPWSFSAEDGNALLGPNGDNWANYGAWHLAIDGAEPEKTKAHYKYPFGKGGKVYRSALIAAKQRAAQQGTTAIADAADEYIDQVDKTKEPDGDANSAAGALERRLFVASEMRVVRAADMPPRIVGHAAVFNQWASIGGMFRERVMPGAFKRAIDTQDVRALFNHDPNVVLGRNRANTLTLSEDATGLRYEIVPPDTQAARDLLISIERGDISQGSFGFRATQGGQQWNWDPAVPERTLTDVDLFDVSPVTFPAYEGTDVAVRHLEQCRAAAQAELERLAPDTSIVRRLVQRAREHGY